MLKVFKKMIAVVLCIVILLGVAPLTGFVGLKLPTLNLPKLSLFQIKAKAESNTDIYNSDVEAFSEGWCYYIDSESGYLYKSILDSEVRTYLTNYRIDRFVLFGQDLYLLISNSIFKLDTVSNQLTLLIKSKMAIDRFSMRDMEIYYLSGGTVYLYNVLSNKTKDFLLKGNIIDFWLECYNTLSYMVDDEYIYSYDFSTNETLKDVNNATDFGDYIPLHKDHRTVEDDFGGSISVSNLRTKFPHGKYWNHPANPGCNASTNNQDSYTSTPCPTHNGYCGTSRQTCNGFAPDGYNQLSWQCMGYAEKCGYDVTGYNPRNNANGWYTNHNANALNSLKAGDVVRYKNGGHSIYITGVSGNTVTFTDCNSDYHCQIKWDKTIQKSTLRSTFSYVRSCPSVSPPDAPVVSMSSRVFTVGQSATLSWSSVSNANQYWVSCWSSTAHEISEENNSFSRTISFNKAGPYSITVTAKNSAGETVGNWVDFFVIDKTPISHAKESLNNHTYTLYYSSMNWEEAKAWCEGNGGYLATITSKDEQQILNNLIANSAGEYGYWLGGEDQSTGEYRWITNEVWDYTNWEINEPNNSAGTEHYIGTIYGSKWNDYSLNSPSPKGFVMETGSPSYDKTPIAENTLELGGHTYTLYNSSMNWEEAKIWCEENGGYLATITSYGEQRVINDLINGRTYNGYWLGGENFTTGEYRWITCETWNYTCWGENQPSNNGGIEHFLGTYHGTEWNDYALSSTTPIGFIMESGTFSVPEINHIWDDGVIEKEATKEENGTIRYTCSACGLTKEEIIPRISVSSIEVNKMPSRGLYYVGDKLETDGLSLNVTYTDGTTEIIKSGFDCYPDLLEYVGNQEIIVQLEDKQTSFNVIVKIEEDAPYWGDVNGDKKVTDEDYRLILRYLKGYEPFTDEQLCFADVDFNGTVNSTDIVIILKYIKGTEELRAPTITKTITTVSRNTYYLGESFNKSSISVTVSSIQNEAVYYTLSDCLEIIDYNSDILGEQNIGVKFRGNLYDTIDIIVVEDKLDSITINCEPNKVEYFKGDTLDTTGFELTASYLSGKKELINSNYSCTPTDLNTIGNQTITVLYCDKTTSFTVNVLEDTVTDIAFDTLPDKTDYYLGDSFTPTGLILTAFYSSGKTEAVTDGFSYSPSILDNTGAQEIEVKYNNHTISFYVNVIDDTVNEISIKSFPSRTTYYTGETNDLAGLTITATYISGKTEVIKTGFTCSPSEFDTVGTQEVIISYSGKTTTYNVNVLEDCISDLAIKTNPDKTIYYVGDTLDTSGLTLIATYLSGRTEIVREGFACVPNELTTLGTQEIVVKYLDKTVSYNVIVNEASLTGISVLTNPNRMNYFVGDTFDDSGLSLTASYDNGNTSTVTAGFKCSPKQLNAIGNQIINISYGDKTTSIMVVVSPVPVDSYTITFKVDGEEYSKSTYEVGSGINLPTNPSKRGYNFKEWNPSVPSTMPDHDVVVNAVFEPINYNAVFVSDGNTVDVIKYTIETQSINEPTVPNKNGYNGRWSNYTLECGGVTIYAIYSPKTFTVPIIVDGEKIGETTYTYGDTVLINLPDVPKKTGYTGEWNYALTSEGATANAVYTPITYYATFKADGKQVGDKVPFTVETSSINEPDVPQKDGYTGKWSTYSLSANDITINAVYTKVKIPLNVSLNVAGTTTLSYRTILTVKATATNLDPAYHLVLVINEKEIEGNNKEVVYDYGEIKNDVNYSVKIVDANGNVLKDGNGNELKQDGGTIKCNAGFFQKLIAFFQGLFKSLPKKTVQP